MERRRSSAVGEFGTVAAVTLSQMVDMALSSPEVGVVRFNILQSLLHAILQTLGIGHVEAHYDVTPVAVDALTNAAETSPPDDVPHRPDDIPMHRPDDIPSRGKMLNKKSSSGLPVLHIVMPAPATCELYPSPGTPFLEVADKVKKIEVRLERLYRAPSNEELLNDTSVNHAGEGAVVNMWQNLQMLRKAEANADGMKQLMTLVNDLVDENKKQWDETQSMKQQVENISRIINTEMEVPSYVTWSSLEGILKGTKSTPCDSGPSSELKDQMRSIGKIDQEVGVLDEKCQVLDDKVQEQEITLKELHPTVGNLVSTIKATSGEINSILKQRKIAPSFHSELDTADEGTDMHNLAGNVRQLVYENDENISKIHEHLNFSGASVERRLLALEEAVVELREMLKLDGFELKLSASDIELSHSPKNLSERALSPSASPADVRASSSGSFDDGKPDATKPAATTSSLGRDVGKPNASNLLTVSSSTPGKKTSSDDVELNAKFGQFGRKLKVQMKQDRIKLNELEAKLRDVAEHVSKLRATVSCDEAQENSCLRLMQRSIEQLQTDIVNVTNLGLEAKALTEKVQQCEDSQEEMLSNLSDTGVKFTQLAVAITDLEHKMQAEEVVWNEFLGGVTDKLAESMKMVHVEMVSVRKDVQCHLHKLNDDVHQLHDFIDDFGDSGAGMRKKLKYQCLSCDRKLLVTSLEPPSDSCPAQAGFQSSLSAHPYTTYEMENVRNRQKSGLLPRQLTNFQRAILERHMARLRMRDFRAYFMQCWNDLPEVKTAKSYKCSTLYEKEANLPDIYRRLSRNSGGPMHMPLPPSSSLVNQNYGKTVEYVDAFNLTQTTSAIAVGNKSSDFSSTKPRANTNLTKKARDSQTPFHPRRNLSHGKQLKCPKLPEPDNPQDCNAATSGEHPVENQQTSTSTSVYQSDVIVTSTLTSSENLFL